MSEETKETPGGRVPIHELQRLIGRFMHDHDLENVKLRKGMLDITWVHGAERTHRDRLATLAAERESTHGAVVHGRMADNPLPPLVVPPTSLRELMETWLERAAASTPVWAAALDSCSHALLKLIEAAEDDEDDDVLTPPIAGKVVEFALGGVPGLTLNAEYLSGDEVAMLVVVPSAALTGKMMSSILNASVSITLAEVKP